MEKIHFQRFFLDCPFQAEEKSREMDASSLREAALGKPMRLEYICSEVAKSQRTKGPEDQRARAKR